MNKKPEFVSLSDLARLTTNDNEDKRISYFCLLQMRHEIFPRVLNNGTRSMYHQKDCLKIWEWFKVLKERGFKTKSIKSELIRTKPQYTEMMKKHQQQPQTAKG